MQRDSLPPGPIAELLSEWSRYLYEVLRPPQKEKKDYKRVTNLPNKKRSAAE